MSTRASGKRVENKKTNNCARSRNVYGMKCSNECVTLDNVRWLLFVGLNVVHETKINIVLGQTPGEMIEFKTVFLVLMWDHSARQLWFYLCHRVRHEGNISFKTMYKHLALRSLHSKQLKAELKEFIFMDINLHIKYALRLCLHRRTLKQWVGERRSEEAWGFEI